MSIHYPNRQTLIIAIVCAIAVLGTIMYVYTETPPQLPEQSSSNALSTNPPDISTFIATSSDDWKKQFFGQSTNNIVSLKNKPTNTSSEATSTLTDKLSQELFARFIQLKQQNLDGNSQLVQDVVNETVDNALQNSGQPQIYTTALIPTIDRPTQNDYMTYGNSVGAILYTYTPKTRATQVAKMAFDQNDMSVFSQIDPITASYQKMIQALLAVRTPSDMAASHIDLVNSVSTLLFISQSIRNTQGDATQAIIAIGSFNPALDTFKSALLRLQNGFYINSITFNNTDPGHLFATITP